MTPGRARWLWLAAPVVFLLVVYHEGLRTWFVADDFAWLGLIRQVHSFRDLLRALFEPAAQGTIRPWSERGFFLLFESLFGLDPLPFRVMVFATMAADLWLLGWLMRKITGSGFAGLIAQVCWVGSASLATIMSWTSAYNEAQCSFFLLLALALFCRFAEKGDAKFWWWQLVVFSLGFGALELNVVYPAIAAGFALFVAPPEKRRRLLLSLAPLAALSVAYFALHRYLAPLPTTGAYVIHADRRIFSTLAAYTKWSLLPMNWLGFGHSTRAGKILLASELAGLTAFLFSEWRRRRPVVLFFCVWFMAALSPILLLPDHRDDYYLTIPVIGLGMLAGFAFAQWRLLSLIPICAYLAAQIPVAHSATHWWLMKTQPVRAVVLGVEAAHASHPDKTILLAGIGQQVYEDSLGQGALFALGTDAYLLPSPDHPIHGTPDIPDPSVSVLDPAVARHALENDQVVVYSISGDHLRNVTERYERFAPARKDDRPPTRVDVGNLLYSWLLGPEWLLPESGVRWMPGRASLRLAAPNRAGQKLSIEGSCPEDQLALAARHITVAADGVPLGEAQINDPEASFVRIFDLPDALVDRTSGGRLMDINIQVTPTMRKDGQEYGLVFGKIAIVPGVL